MTTLTVIRFAGQMHHVRPRLSAFLEIEDELGSLAAFARRLEEGRWRRSELIAAVQILLAEAGCQADYETLGDEILQSGVEGYRRTLGRLLAAFNPTPAAGDDA